MAGLVALLSAISNLQLHSEISTAVSSMDAPLYAYHLVRSIFSALLNTGTLWAGQLIIAGWLLARRTPWQSAAAGAYTGFLSLTLHYIIYVALSRLPMFTPVSIHIFYENLNWYMMTAIAGIPLGLLGYAIRPPATSFIRRLPYYAIPLGASGESVLLTYSLVTNIAAHPPLTSVDIIRESVTILILLLMGIRYLSPPTRHVFCIIKPQTLEHFLAATTYKE